MALVETSTRSGRTAAQVHALAAPSTRFANWNFCNFWCSAGASDSISSFKAFVLLYGDFCRTHISPLHPIQSHFQQKVLCGPEGRPSRRRQNPSECESYGCSDAAQLNLQCMLTEFVFGFDSDFILRALLQLVCEEQPPWLLLPLQSMLSRLVIEHGQVYSRMFLTALTFLVSLIPLSSCSN
jgi:hypothetical protein